MGINGRLTLHFWLYNNYNYLSHIPYQKGRHFWVDDVAPFTIWWDMLVPWNVIKKIVIANFFSWTIRCRIRCPNINQYGVNWVAPCDESFFLCNAIWPRRQFFSQKNHRKLWIDGVGKGWLQQKAWTKKNARALFELWSKFIMKFTYYPCWYVGLCSSVFWDLESKWILRGLVEETVKHLLRSLDSESKDGNAMSIQPMVDWWFGIR